MCFVVVIVLVQLEIDLPRAPSPLSVSKPLDGLIQSEVIVVLFAYVEGGGVSSLRRFHLP